MTKSTCCLSFFTALLLSAQATAAEPLVEEPCCHSSSHYWQINGSLDYLCAWRAKRETPVLVTTAPFFPVTAQMPTARLPIPQSPLDILFGGREMGDSPRPGIRGELFLWRDEQLAIGVEGLWVRDESNHAKLMAAHDNDPDISVPTLFPYFGFQTGALSRYFVGSLFTHAKAALVNELWSVEGTVKWRFLHTPCYCVELLAGYHRCQVDDSLTLSAKGTIFALTSTLKNRFAATNDFHGGIIGLRAAMQWRCWQLSLAGKLSLGEMRSRVKISGGYRSDPTTALIVGFVQESNRGSHTKTQWELIPQLNLRLSYQLNQSMALSVGYLLVYWPKLFLAGEQVDPAITVTDTIAAPKAVERLSSFWLQGVTAGLHFRF